MATVQKTLAPGDTHTQAKSTPAKPATALPATAVHRMILDGLPAAGVATFEKKSGIALRDIRDVLRLTPRTLSVRQAAGKLSADESERLHRLQTVFAAAVGMFNGDAAAAARWLRHPRPALSGSTPLELTRTEVGGQAVLTLIWQVENGVVV